MIHQLSRRSACALLLAATSGIAFAEAYPSGPVSLVVAYAPGGSTDLVARMLAQEMSVGLKQAVIVENKPGGGTLIGTQYVQRAPANGQTLLFATNAFVITSLTQRPSPWDPLTSFEPIALVTQQSLGVLVRPGLNVGSIKDLIAYAKANPGKLNFASSGNGSAQHIAGEALKKAAGIDMVHVPYKGAGPAIQDLIGGRVDVMITSLLGLSEHITAKRVVLMATTGAQRVSSLPDVPTVSESGVPNFKVEPFQALLAPPKTPPAVIQQLSVELTRIARQGTLAKRLAEQGMDLRIGSPADLRALLTRERNEYAQLLKTVNVQ